MFLLIGFLILSLAITGQTLVLLRVNKSLQEKYESLIDLYNAWVSTPDEKTPSKLTEFIDKTGNLIAGHAGQAVTASIRGALGGTMKGVNAEAIEQITGENPQLALFQTLAPGAFKKLSKKPAAMMGLQAILSGIGVGGNKSNGNGQTVVRRHRD